MSLFTCQWCGDGFKGSTHGNAKNLYCSENCRKRRHENACRASCPDCGAPMRAGSGYPKGAPKRCRSCNDLIGRTQVDERAQKFEKWWAEGLSLKEIAKRLNRSIGYVHMEMDRLRSKGYDLPYRYRPGTKNGTKFSELRKVA